MTEEDGRKIITQTEEGFTFNVMDRDHASFSEETIGNGITVVSERESHMVSSLIFDGDKWQFEDVRKWLSEQELNPSDIETAQLEEETFLYLEEIEHPIEIISQNEEFTHKGNSKLLKIEALAITPGTHKGFKFTSEVLQEAVPLYNGVNLVINHKTQASDVVGWIAKSVWSERGPLVKAAIHNSRAQERVTSGELNSTSSNFFLRANKQKEVKKIMKLVELTLTGRPADPGAVITDMEAVTIDLEEIKDAEDDTPIGVANFVKTTNSTANVSEKQTDSVYLGGLTLSETEPETAEPSTEGEAAQLENEIQRVLSLEERLVQLEKENARLNADVDSMAKQARVELSATKAGELESLGKILPNQRSAVEALYLSFTPDQEKLFHEVMQGQPKIVDYGDEGVPLQEQPRLSDEEVETLILQQIDSRWQAWGGDGPQQQQPHLQQRAGFTLGPNVTAQNPFFQRQTVTAQDPVGAPTPAWVEPSKPEGIREIDPRNRGGD